MGGGSEMRWQFLSGFYLDMSCMLIEGIKGGPAVKNQGQVRKWVEMISCERGPLPRVWLFPVSLFVAFFVSLCSYFASRHDCLASVCGHFLFASLCGCFGSLCSCFAHFCGHLHLLGVILHLFVVMLLFVSPFGTSLLHVCGHFPSLCCDTLSF